MRVHRKDAAAELDVEVAVVVAAQADLSVAADLGRGLFVAADRDDVDLVVLAGLSSADHLCQIPWLLCPLVDHP